MAQFRHPSGQFGRRGGGGYPGDENMRASFPRNSEASRRRSPENSAMEQQETTRGPSAPGEYARPGREARSNTPAATSPVPTSILASGPSTFGPLEYATADKTHNPVDQNQSFERSRGEREPDYRGKVRP
jgi:hypothetical protein